jgi:hypothetical protein
VDSANEASTIVDGGSSIAAYVDLPSFGGFWADVAIDGIVLFERGLLLSRALIAVRREILALAAARDTVECVARVVPGSEPVRKARRSRR